MQRAQRAFGVGRGNVSLRLPRIYPRRLALAVMFVMTARAFYMLPLMSSPSEGWNVLCFLFLCFMYIGWKAKAGERFIGLEIYVLLLMAALPLWSGIMALHVFGQPLLYGVLTQRANILGVGALAVIMFFRLGWIDTEDIEEGLKILAWGTLIIYTIYALAQFGMHSSESSGPQVRLNVTFISIGFLFYGIRAFTHKSKLDYVLASPFLVYLVLHGERALLLSVVGAYGLFILIRGSFARLIVFVPMSVVGAAALVGILFAANPSYMTELGGRFVDAFTVVTTGQTTQDISANLRLEETAVAIPYIENSPLMGNGDLSNRWRGGYSGVMQAYYYPSDVGVFGIMYMYGAVGMALFAVQFWFAWRFAKTSTEGATTPPMRDAVIAFLLSYAVQSISTGALAFNWPIGTILIAYLYCASVEVRRRRGGQLRRRPRFDNMAGLQQPPA